MNQLKTTHWLIDNQHTLSSTVTQLYNVLFFCDCHVYVSNATYMFLTDSLSLHACPIQPAKQLGDWQRPDVLSQLSTSPQWQLWEQCSPNLPTTQYRSIEWRWMFMYQFEFIKKNIVYKYSKEATRGDVTLYLYSLRNYNNNSKRLSVIFFFDRLIC